MSRTRGTSDNLHPRLSVALAAAAERDAIVEALADAVIVDATAMRRAARVAADRRRVDDEAAIDALEADLVGLSARRDSAASALDDLNREQQRLVEAAEWCLRQPAEDAAGDAQEAALGIEIEGHSQAVRTATRELERVLEQRAAATAALEEARRELAGLGATGIGEPEVRRDMEAASGQLRAAATAHQEAMADAARLRHEVERLRAVGPGATVTMAPDGDRFQAMRRALDERYAQSAAGSDGPVELAAEALERAEARAEATAAALSAARRRVDAFEQELSARSSDAGARDARHRAATELEAQVASVERRLREAETAARHRMDESSHAVSRAELARDRLRQEARRRRRRVTELLALVPSAEQPAPTDDVLDCVGDVAAAMRTMADQMVGDIGAAEDGLRRLEARCDERAAEIAGRRSALGAIVARDRIAALTDLVADATGLLVLDDAVSAGDSPDAALTVDDLTAAALTVPVIVLSADPAVVAWAIDLPPAEAAVVPVAALTRRPDPAPAHVTDLTTDRGAHEAVTEAEPAPSHAR